MASSFEQLVFEIIATDKNASAAFDRFRQKVDQTSRTVDDNTTKLDKNSEALDKSAKSADKATPAFSALAGGAGNVSGMGALVAAGVALSPVIATVGLGLTGLGVAAVGVVSPVLKAAQAAGGLRANMAKLDPEQRQLAVSVLGLGKQYDKFQKSLAPQVLGIFGKGIQLAGRLMGDLQPIAKATGVALEQVLGRIDTEFRSGTWQKFFTWMAQNAGPDINLLGDAFINLLDSLPQLLTDLQPIATGLLQITDAATKALGPLAKLGDAAVKSNQAQLHAAGSLDSWTVKITNAIPGAKALNDSITADQNALRRFFGAAKPAADSTQALADRLRAAHTAAADLIHPVGTFTNGLQSAHVATTNETIAVTALTTALKGLSSGLLTSEQDQVSWRQAQQAATVAIKANTGSLDSNKASALLARAAIIGATQGALAFANQELKTKDGVSKASDIIRAQINWLQQHAGHSRIAAAEVDALRGALAKLHNKAVTITETGTGHFSIFGRNTSSTPKLAGGAQGLFINRGTSATADDVLVRASKGELIVPTKMVSAGLVDHLRGSIPGFAAGGLAGLPGQTSSFDSRFQAQFTAAMKSAMTAAMRTAVAAAQAAARSFAGGPGGGAPSANAALARRLYPQAAFGPSWAAWNYVAMRESGWNQFARNPSSGAYGIPQALPPSKMGAAANPPQSNPTAQIRWMWNYMATRYGGPQGAAAHERAFNWYDQGGWLPPGASLAYNATGQPEQVVGPAQMAQVVALLAQILAAVRVAPAATSAGTARALNSAARAAVGAR